MPSELLSLFGQDHFQFKGGLVWFFLPLSFITEISVPNAISVDPDQMPHSAASDLGLHCLSVSLFWDARHKWVKEA